ncbi:MAG: ATP-binding cassette domain-containing protein [Spirochaetia bacterium]|nr:ATP-binding cassette domain-containing protein [Spirochaetia bacterium]
MRIHIKVHIKQTQGFVLDVDEQCQTNSLGIIGASGSGKSTLLDAIAGIQPALRFRLDEIDLANTRIENRNIGYVTQKPLLFPHMSVRRNLLYSPRAQKLDDVVSTLGISKLLDRMPGKLSGGESRRVALARAILSRPDLLLLDEPFAGLDETSRREAMSLLDNIRKTVSIPMILVSHAADEIIGLTDWSIRLQSGRVVARGPTESILRSSETRIDNYFSAQVVAPGKVRLGNLELSILMPHNVTGTVRLACYAHDILLANANPEGISARNVFQTRIITSTRIENATLLVVEPNLRVVVTSEASHALKLNPGNSVYAILKASSIAYLGQQQE